MFYPVVPPIRMCAPVWPSIAARSLRIDRGPGGRVGDLGGAADGGEDDGALPAAKRGSLADRTCAAFCASVPGMVKLSLVLSAAGGATSTIVAPSRPMSWAVAMTARARPSRGGGVPEAVAASDAAALLTSPVGQPVSGDVADKAISLD